MTQSGPRATLAPSRDIRLPARDHGGAAHARRPAAPGTCEQDFATIAPYTIEEAYEVADAIERGDLVDLRGRARRPAAAGRVPRPAWPRRPAPSHFGDVVEAITTKLIRRHPHVFGDARDLAPAEVKALWDADQG